MADEWVHVEFSRFVVSISLKSASVKFQMFINGVEVEHDLKIKKLKLKEQYLASNVIILLF